MAKTKALISCAVTAQLICVFDFAYGNHWVSYAAAQIKFLPFVYKYLCRCTLKMHYTILIGSDSFESSESNQMTECVVIYHCYSWKTGDKFKISNNDTLCFMIYIVRIHLMSIGTVLERMIVL